MNNHLSEGILLFIVLIILDALFFGFSSAIQGINKSLVEKRAQETGYKKSVLLNAMIEEPYRFVNTIQVVMTLINVFAGLYQVPVFSGAILAAMGAGADAQSSMTRLLVTAGCFIGVVYLILTLGVLVPKKLGQKYCDSWAYRFVGLMRGAIILLTPVTLLVEVSTGIICRLFGLDPGYGGDDITEEEIISMVNEAHEQGDLEASEAEMIHNIFAFDDKDAKDIMTHRKNIVAVNGELTIDEALNYILKQNYTRFPVYEGDLDNIIGLINLKDIMIAYRGNAKIRNRQLKTLKGILREAVFIPETRSINLLFKSMQSRKIHMVMVADEYGQTSGLVAMEDILEEIVGNILDEYDKEDVMISKLQDDMYLLDGMAALEDLEEMLQIRFETEDCETLNGFLISLLDRIPSEDEEITVEYGGYVFQVLKVENKMIKTVKAAPKKESSEDL